jgi:hypothetical protein
MDLQILTNPTFSGVWGLVFGGEIGSDGEPQHGVIVLSVHFLAVSYRKCLSIHDLQTPDEARSIAQRVLGEGGFAVC